MAKARSAVGSRREKRTGIFPVLAVIQFESIRRGRERRAASGLPRATPPLSEAILQPRRRYDEQRGENEAEQRIQPDQRDVKAAEAEADPKCSERTVSFQASNLSRDWTERGKYSQAAKRIPGRGRRENGYLASVTLRDTTSIRHAVGAALASEQPGSERRFVLAVSGGIDSMVLLDAAAATTSVDRLTVATFDHGTGAAAAEACALVVTRAAAMGVECVSARAADTLTSEAELRSARWSFLRRVASDIHADVCTAHTADDQTETILMRVLRDAGARGLAGLYADSAIVRPLLHTSRRDVVRYARARRIPWIDDPSNESPKYFRNRVRHDLLPALRRVRPSIDADLLALAETAARWRREVEAFVAASIDVRAVGARGLDVSVASVGSHGAGELAVVWPAIAARVGLALDRRGTKRLVEFTNSGQVGGSIQLSGGWEVVRSRDAFQLRSFAHTEPTPAALALSNSTTWGEWSFRPVNGQGNADDSWSSWLPVDRPLSVRAWQAGDAMHRANGGASKKVKRMLSEAGVTGHERTRWPVVLAGDQIVWIPGVSRSSAATDRSGRPGLSFVCDYDNR
jgi:tRNA(Ile)-lysidine synthase